MIVYVLFHKDAGILGVFTSNHAALGYLLEQEITLDGAKCSKC